MMTQNKNWQAQQAEFMVACNQAIRTLKEASTFHDEKDRRRKLQHILLGTNLINEECVVELLQHLRFIKAKYSYDPHNMIAVDELADVYDGIVDSIYVLCWLANAMGFDIDAGFEEVHRSNMAKVIDGKVILREDGKILKPSGWKPPALRDMIIAQLAAEGPTSAPAVEEAENKDKNQWQIDLTQSLHDLKEFTSLDNPIAMALKNKDHVAISDYVNRLEAIAADARRAIEDAK